MTEMGQSLTNQVEVEWRSGFWTWAGHPLTLPKASESYKRTAGVSTLENHSISNDLEWFHWFNGHKDRGVALILLLCKAFASTTVALCDQQISRNQARYQSRTVPKVLEWSWIFLIILNLLEHRTYLSSLELLLGVQYKNLHTSSNSPSRQSNTQNWLGVWADSYRFFLITDDSPAQTFGSLGLHHRDPPTILCSCQAQ